MTWIYEGMKGLLFFGQDGDRFNLKKLLAENLICTFRTCAIVNVRGIFVFTGEADIYCKHVS